MDRDALREAGELVGGAMFVPTEKMTHVTVRAKVESADRMTQLGFELFLDLDSRVEVKADQPNPRPAVVERAGTDADRGVGPALPPAENLVFVVGCFLKVYLVDGKNLPVGMDFEKLGSEEWRGFGARV